MAASKVKTRNIYKNKYAEPEKSGLLADDIECMSEEVSHESSNDLAVLLSPEHEKICNIDIVVDSKHDTDFNHDSRSLTDCEIFNYESYDQTCVKSLIHAQSMNTPNSSMSPVANYFDQSFYKLPPGKRYHLFASHSSEDSAEVKVICNELEKRFRLKCMNCERDFVAGKLIDANINDEMESSLKVLIVLSPSYLESHWCMSEALRAVELSYKTDHNTRIIPVLLRTLGKEMPPFLKSYRYIDAQKEDDVPRKIMDAFYHSAAVNVLYNEQRGYTDEEQRQQNGARLFFKEAVRLSSFWSKNYFYEFPYNTDQDQEKLNFCNADCKDQINAAVARVNDSPLMRHYRLFIGRKYIFLIGIILSILVTAIIVGTYCWVVISKRKRDNSESGIVLLTLVSGAAVFGGTLICTKFIKRTIVFNTRKLLWTVNTVYFEKTKCLIVFGNSSAVPNLTAIRYDTSKCKDYLCILLEERHRSYKKDRIRALADRLIKRKLAKMQETGVLLNWTSLPFCDYNRHNTWNKKTCLCQMLEDDIISPKTIITV